MQKSKTSRMNIIVVEGRKHRQRSDPDRRCHSWLSENGFISQTRHTHHNKTRAKMHSDTKVESDDESIDAMIRSPTSEGAPYFLPR